MGTRPTAIGSGHRVTVGLAARVEDVVTLIRARAPARNGGRHHASTLPDGEAGEASGPLHPVPIMRALRQVLPPYAVVAVDTGLMTLWYGRSFPAEPEIPVISGRWRSMGFALRPS
ncbi:MAG: hypothetical protein ACP5QO_01135 [Clostridia bacterium]